MLYDTTLEWDSLGILFKQDPKVLDKWILSVI